MISKLIVQQLLCRFEMEMIILIPLVLAEKLHEIVSERIQAKTLGL